MALLVACSGEGEVDRSDVTPRPDVPVSSGPAVRGKVTNGTEGVAGAVVRFGGRQEHAVTDENGAFTLNLDGPPIDFGQIALTAGAPGYFSRGVAFVDSEQSQVIELDRIDLVDNPDYEYKSPDALDATPHCLHCHKEQTAEWSTSAHSQSARDPFLHDVYNGTALGFTDKVACEGAGGAWREGKGGIEKCYVGVSVLEDLNPGACGNGAMPTCDSANAMITDAGPCADCHAPASDAHAPGATNINEVTGLGYEAGVHCDFCHKIANVSVNERPGVFGAIEVLRPGPPVIGGFANPEIMFGPYDDVILSVMGGTPQPQFRTSELCSGCHQWSEMGMRAGDKAFVDPVKWPNGIPIQDTYYEWSQSPSAVANLHCQNCHMPALDVKSSVTDLGLPPDTNGVFGWPREYGQVRSHAFMARLDEDPTYVPAPGDPTRDSLRDPIDVVVDTTRTSNNLVISVALTNRGAGHSIPTGTPSRALIMTVQAMTESGTRLPATDGYTVPLWTGALATGELAAPIVHANELSGVFPTTIAPGDIVRFVLPSASYDDYPATRWFGDPARMPAEKGMEIHTPSAEAAVVAVQADKLTLDRTVSVPAGALYAVGSALVGGKVDDESPIAALAGAPGYAFGKILADRDGVTNVAFWRSVDVVSDNRIPAGKTASTTHTFDASDATGAPVEVTVTLLYRKHPWWSARARGWDGVDVVRYSKSVIVSPR